MVGLAYGTPTTTILEERYDVVDIVSRGLKIHEERLMTVICEYRSRQHRTLEAVGAIFAQYAPRREIGLPGTFKIDRERVQVVLDTARRAEIFEYQTLLII